VKNFFQLLFLRQSTTIFNLAFQTLDTKSQGLPKVFEKLQETLATMKFKEYFAFCILIGLSSGAQPEFSGFPAVSTALESATGSFSDLFDQLMSSLMYIVDNFHPLNVLKRSLPNVIQALASLVLNQTKTTTSSSDGIAQILNGQAREDIMKNCFFKTSNVDAGVCPDGCYMWALQGKCLCPRITKDDCEIEKHCYWLVAEGKCTHSRPGGIQALVSLFNPLNTTNRIAQNLNGVARMLEQPKESCRFKMRNANALNGCPADCATLFPAIPGQCLCPRNTKDDCETDEGCYWSVVAQAEGKCIHQMDRLYNALFKKLDKRGDTTDVTYDPNFDQDFTYAFSIALSPVAAAGVSKTGEIGVAFGSNGEILGYAGSCLGLKADISVELDIMLGFWNSIDDMLGTIYQLGFGADTTELKDEKGNDETGAHVEQIYNSVGNFIGGAISLGYGHGVDLPIDFEINFDKCYNYELWRFSWKDLFNMIMGMNPT